MFEDDDWIPRCVKFSVFFTNFLYWFLSVFTVGIGLHVHVDQMQPMAELVTLSVNPAFLLMTLGALLFVTAILGCVGTLRENLCLLKSYLIALLFLLMIHVALGAVAFIVLFTNSTVHDKAEDTLQKAILYYRDDQNLTDFISYIQSTFRCCGIGASGFRDWTQNPYFRCSHQNLSPEKCGVPPSCCKAQQINLMCGYGINNSSIDLRGASAVIHTSGCVIRIEETLQSASVILSVVAFGVSVPLLCGVLLSGRMIKCVENHMRGQLRRFQKKYPLHLIPRSHVYHITEPRAVTFLKRTPVD